MPVAVHQRAEPVPPGRVQHLICIKAQDPVAPGVLDREIVRPTKVTWPGGPDHPSAGVPSDVGRAVARPRVNDDDLVYHRAAAIDTISEKRRLVPRHDAER